MSFSILRRSRLLLLTEYNGKIYISARSIDEINVQIIMERLGGGGHINTAGASFHIPIWKERLKL